MSTVEETPVQTNGAAAAGQIEVLNPATGQVIRTVPDMTPAQVKELVDRARAAQPGWQALGFEGRARYMMKLKSWFIDNKERVLASLMEETGKTREDAAGGGLDLRDRLVQLLGEEGRELPRREEGAVPLAVPARQEAARALRPGRGRRASSAPGTSRSRSRSATPSPP